MKKLSFLILGVLLVSGTILANTTGSYGAGISISDTDGASRKGITITAADGYIKDSNFENFEFTYNVTREREQFSSTSTNSYNVELGLGYQKDAEWGILNSKTSGILYEDKQGLSQEFSGIYNLDSNTSITAKAYLKQLFMSTDFNTEDSILQGELGYNKNIGYGTVSILGEFTPVNKESTDGIVEEDESTVAITTSYSQDINEKISVEGYISYVNGTNDAEGYTNHKINKTILGVSSNYAINSSFSINGDLSHTFSLVDTDTPAAQCASSDDTSLGFSLTYSY